MTTTVPAEIAQFAARVRAALADLPADELEELTDGLEADLSEAFAEDLARELPDPVAYAAELRTAAGLPPAAPAPSGVRGAFDGLGEGVRAVVADVAQALRRHPVSRGALELAVEMRPLWWVVRAWLAAWLTAAFFGSEAGWAPTSPWWWGVLLTFVAVSVQWGRGRWGAESLGVLIAVGNVVAVVALLPVLAAADSSSSRYYPDDAYSAGPYDSRGISLDGQSVTNIYPYDAQGQPLEGVQLFDQDGRALAPALDWNRDECADCEANIDAEGKGPVAAVLETGQEVENVFPLAMAQYVLDELSGATSETVGEPAVPAAPFIKVPALAQDAAKASGVIVEDDAR